MQNDIQLVMLGGESGDRVSNFIRNNLPNGDPLFAALCERMKPEQYEGSQFECTMDFLYSVCVNPTSSTGIEPYSFAMMQNGRYLAISLGTRETYPKDYDFRDMAGIRGRHASSYFHLLNKAEEAIGEKTEGKLNGKRIHNCRLWLVDEEYRNKGIGSFLLTNTIQLAHKDSCDAVLFSATGASAKRVAQKLKLTAQLTIAPSDEDEMFQAVNDDLHCYLVLFKPL